MIGQRYVRLGMVAVIAIVLGALAGRPLHRYLVGPASAPRLDEGGAEVAPPADAGAALGGKSPHGRLPGAVIGLVERALQKKAVARHQTAGEFAAGIDEALDAVRRPAWRRLLH